MPKVWFVDEQNRTYRVVDGMTYTYVPGIADTRAKRELVQSLQNESESIAEGWRITYDFTGESPLTEIPPPIRPALCCPRSTVPEPRKLNYVRTRIAFKPRI